MIKIKSGRDLERMRIPGHMAGQVRDELAQMIKSGMTTMDVDDFAAERISSFGGVATFHGYMGFPGHICISINEEVVHGIPGGRVIQDGDLVSIDVGVTYGGYIGDTALTVAVGRVGDDVMALLKNGEEALAAGLSKAVAGGRLSDISHAVQTTAETAGYSVVREFVGHGIGRKLHEDPQIPNFGQPGQGPKLKSGMTLAIEPMINLGRKEVHVLGDGWTVVTEDKLPSVHIEHTVAIRPEGPPEILTCG